MRTSRAKADGRDARPTRGGRPPKPQDQKKAASGASALPSHLRILAEAPSPAAEMLGKTAKGRATGFTLIELGVAYQTHVEWNAGLSQDYVKHPAGTRRRTAMPERLR